MTDPELVVAVLGAGRGVRLGGGKLDLDLGGRPLGAWALRAAMALGARVIAIVAKPNRAFLADAPMTVEVLINGQVDIGMASSLGLAARAAQAHGARRLLVMLADMPLIDASTLSALVRQTDESSVTACRYPDQRLGPPACFGAERIPALLGLAGDRGAGLLLAGKRLFRHAWL